MSRAEVSKITLRMLHEARRLAGPRRRRAPAGYGAASDAWRDVSPAAVGRLPATPLQFFPADGARQRVAERTLGPIEHAHRPFLRELEGGLAAGGLARDVQGQALPVGRAVHEQRHRAGAAGQQAAADQLIAQRGQRGRADGAPSRLVSQVTRAFSLSPPTSTGRPMSARRPRAPRRRAAHSWLPRARASGPRRPAPRGSGRGPARRARSRPRRR